MGPGAYRAEVDKAVQRATIPVRRRLDDVLPREVCSSGFLVEGSRADNDDDFLSMISKNHADQDPATETGNVEILRWPGPHF